jgi:anti-sigma factor RsiW
MTCEEAQELITALVDQELSDPERSSLDAHLKECARCRLALQEERTLKQEIWTAGQSVRAPSDLRDRIFSDPRIFPEEVRSLGKPWDFLWPTPNPLRPVFAAALVVLVVLAVFYWFQQRSGPVSLAALETYDLFLKGELSVRRAEPVEIAEQLTRAVSGHFHPMGYDLTAMDLRPVAGLVREINGRKVLVAIYEGKGGTLFCYTFIGSEADAPPNAAKFFDTAKNINFYAFSRGEVNAVFHREGDLICILASTMPMDKLLALAQSKAKAS